MNFEGPARVELSRQTMLFGEGAAGARLAAEVRSHAWRRVALFASGSAMRSGLVERVAREALAGCTVVATFGSIQGHAPIADTEQFARDLDGLGVDALIVVGGGSPSDTAKAVAILLAEGGRLEDHCSVFEPPDRLHIPDLPESKVPVVAVVTTFSGAEVTPGGGATTVGGTKRTFWDPEVACRVIAYDPAVFADVPADVLVTTGMNGIAHCAEGLYSRTANPVSSALAVAGARALAVGLRGIAASGERPTAALESGGSGAALGGLVISNARVGLHHAVCHVLGGSLDVPHGVANSVMLPHVLRFNLPETREPQAAFARALAGDGAADDPPAAVERFQREVGAPRRLRDVGVGENDLESVARGAMHDRGLYFNPRRVQSHKEVIDVLRAAW